MTNQVIPAEAVEAAMQAWLERSGKPGAWSLEEEVRAALEAAAPYMLRNVWQSAYDQGVDDERTSQANPGIAGCFCYKSPCGCFIAPARENPYMLNNEGEK